MSRSTVIKSTHGEAKRDIDASLCKRTAIMTVMGQCPNCESRAFHNAEGWDCHTCGWVQYSDFADRSSAHASPNWPPVWNEKSNRN